MENGLQDVSLWDFSLRQLRLFLKSLSLISYVPLLNIHVKLELTHFCQYFTHERGSYMGLYAFTLAGSNYFTPVICGFIAGKFSTDQVL